MGGTDSSRYYLLQRPRNGGPPKSEAPPERGLLSLMKSELPPTPPPSKCSGSDSEESKGAGFGH
jgi:hypothetical protein